jgi:hypothetical protein
MINIKENLWLLVIVGGILGIVSILTPAWGDIAGSMFGVTWWWNLYYLSGYDYIGFIQTDELIYYLDLAVFILIVIGTSILLIGGILDKFKDKKLPFLHLIGGVLLIIGPLVFLGGVETAYSGFFRDYLLNVGCILPFVGGALGIVSGVLEIIEKRS